MDWKGRRASTNVEDRRGRSPKGVIGGGIGTIVILLLVIALGGDPTQLIGGMQSASTEASYTYVETAEEKELADFVSVVLAETEDVWTERFQKEGLEYVCPKLVLYSGSVETPYGLASSSTGPFYSPSDQKVYIDLSFYDELKKQFQAPGDFAMAYVVAHEVGHHIQNQLGVSEKVHALRDKLSEEEYNEYSVRMELQADYYAGVWAHYEQRMNVLEEGDLEEALTAASAVGDDRIQKKARGYAVPETFTHGTSEQRSRWFMKGYRSGDMNGGDTFHTDNL